MVAGNHLNSHFPAIPPGTLSANLIGGYIVGVAIAFFASYSAIAPEWRLFVIGFCGGLTTFPRFRLKSSRCCSRGRVLGDDRRGGPRCRLPGDDAGGHRHGPVVKG
jgi:CrcB protein